jgi:hypothetical protein
MIDRNTYPNLPLSGKRITLCGSTRFRDAFHYWNTNLTLAGNIVYSVAIWAHTQDASSKPTEEEKTLLDSVHLKKIDNSDAIFVLDVHGYIGESTKNEIQYASKSGKQVYFLSEIAPDWCQAGGVSENDSQFSVASTTM